MASFLQRCSDAEKQAWSAAAKAEGVSLAGWVRSRLNAALTEGGERPGTDAPEPVDPVRPPEPPSVRAKPKPSHCPHGLPKGFCLNPRCK